MISSVRKLIPKRDTTKTMSAEQAELQSMLPSGVTVEKSSPTVTAAATTDGPKKEGLCLMTESPFRILRVSITCIYIYTYMHYAY